MYGDLVYLARLDRHFFVKCELRQGRVDRHEPAARDPNSGRELRDSEYRARTQAESVKPGRKSAHLGREFVVEQQPHGFPDNLRAAGYPV